MVGIKILDQASLTEQEVLEVLGIDSNKLKQLVYSGLISKFHIRGKMEYMPSNIKRYLLTLKKERKSG